VVYAGAILVTFLFVLMLSEPDGHASYDRHSWEARTSAFTGAILLGILTSMIGAAITHAEAAKAPQEVSDAVPAKVISPPATSPPPTVSNLGAVLFTQYLVATEAVGALLFAALVGAAVIVTQGRAAMKRPAATRPAATMSGPRGPGGAAHVS
jgi:NADH-quinone oxidoreductase subunit J